VPLALDSNDTLQINITLPPAVAAGPLQGDEVLVEGARRMLRRLFEKMLNYEQAVRSDHGVEDVHQMRVATRKLRASLLVIAPLYESRPIKQYRRKLRRLAAALGAVRDLDVFISDIQSYRADLEPDAQADLTPLSTVAEQRRAAQIALLIHELSSSRYDRFKQDFARFLTTPEVDRTGTTSPDPAARVRHGAGSLIWQRYEQWRAFETVLQGADDTTLHHLRIASKYLRYTLEFFADALGTRVDALLEPLIHLQQNLGTIHDHAVARQRVQELGLSEDTATQRYLMARDHDRTTHLATFTRLWSQIDSATYRRRLFEAIIRL